MTNKNKKPLASTLKNSASRLGLRALEPRILLDAAGFVTGADVAMEVFDTQNVAEDMAMIFDGNLAVSPRGEILPGDDLITALNTVDAAADTAPVTDDGHYEIHSGETINVDLRANDSVQGTLVGIIDPADPNTIITLIENETVELSSGLGVALLEDGTFDVTGPSNPTERSVSFDYVIQDSSGEEHSATATFDWPVDPTIDLDVNNIPPVPGQNGFASLDFSNLDESAGSTDIGNDGQTERADGVGNGEFAIYRNAGIIDGESVDVVATFTRFISDTNEFAPATTRDGDNPNIGRSGSLAQVTIGNSFTGDNNAGTFEIRYDVVLSGTDIPVTGNFAITISDLDAAAGGIRGEEIAVYTANLDSFVIGDSDPASAASGLGSDITVLDGQGTQVFTGLQDPSSFSEDGLIRFSPFDTDPRGTDAQVNSVQLNYTNTSSFTIIFHREAQPGGFNLDASNNASIFDNPVLVDTNDDFANVFTEGDDPIAIAANTIEIFDDLSISSAIIEITNAQLDDVIAVTGTLPVGITATVNSPTSITLTGNATPDAYEQAILAITFENTSTEPNDTVIREIDITLTDDEARTSNTATSFIQVIDLPNEVPTIDLDQGENTNVGFENMFTEGDDPISVAALAANVDDIGEGDIVLLTIAPANISDGTAEIITFNGDNGSSVSLVLDGSDTSQQSLTIGGTDVFIQFNALSGQFEITESTGATIPQDDLDALISAITYENTSQAPTDGDGTDRTLTFQVTDAGGQQSNEAVSTLTVIAIEIDTDGDGVEDFEDVDDDNDGILDVVEQPATIETIEYTGANQTFTVPAGVTEITISAWGAGGGAAAGVRDAGGAGGFAGGTFAVNEGDVITLVVGEGGERRSTVDTYGGGGAGGNAPDVHDGSSGGGRSAILINGVEVLTAGGGGGAASSVAGTQSSFAGAGGGDGATYQDAAGNYFLDGAAATVGATSGAVIDSSEAGGQGGTSTAGGAGGQDIDTRQTTPGQAGQAFEGGDGANSPTGNAGGGGGGGGGFFGGGGGQGQSSAGTLAQDRSGGGGSSFVDNAATDVTLLGGSGALTANTDHAQYVAGVGEGGDTAAESGGNGLIVIEYTPPPTDSDSDGIADHLDIDSDNDGITDNIEAQSTADYIAPSGIEDGITDLNQDGLDDNYDTRTVVAGDSAATEIEALITPVNTDGTDNPDYLDTDSDNEGGNDTAEAGLTGTATGLSTDANDADGDGLFDVFDTQGGTDADDGFNVNESLAAGAFALPDADGDATDGVPLTADVDFRDAQEDRPDTDGDGIVDVIDVDDDNDGILDVVESSQSLFVTEFQGTFGTLPNDISSPANPNQRDLQTNVPGYVFRNVNNGEGQYAVVNAEGAANFRPDAFFEHLVDNTAGDEDGGFLVVNGSTAEGVFFNEPITLDANTEYDLGFFAANGVPSPLNQNFPFQIGIRVIDSNGTVVADIFDAPQTSIEWQEVSGRFNTLGETDFRIEVYNVSRSASGNDFAIDDIYVRAAGDTFVPIDTDQDGIYDHLDIDSDNDGITDNIEAQTTTGFIAPSGVGGTPGFTDVNLDGLDDAFDNRNADNGNTLDADSSAATQTEALITPVNTDGTDNPDYLDTDSDNEGGNDTAEAGLTGTATGLSTDANDADGDGLFDVFETQGGTDADDGFNVNESLDAGAFALPDIDGDAADGVPLTADVDFRDAQEDRPDTDSDGILDVFDVDDDNDGILDTLEAQSYQLVLLPTNATTSIFGLHQNNPEDYTNPNLTFEEQLGVKYRFNLNGSAAAGIPAFNTTFISDDLLDGSLGAGLTDSRIETTAFNVRTVNNAHLDPFANDHFVQLQFATLDSFPQGTDGLALNSLRVNNTNINGGGTVPITIQVSTDNFETSVELLTNQLLVDQQVINFDNALVLEEGQTYQIRIYYLDEATSGFDDDWAFGFQEFSSTDPNVTITDTVISNSQDSDNDGIADHLDIDSDNDGITDNIEAQTTLGYIAPSGVGRTPGFTDVNLDGLDDAFDNRNADNGNTLDANSSAATQIEALITPVNTDGTDNPDYLDTDSDNDGLNDTLEADLGTARATGLSTDATDADGDGLFDVFEAQGGTDADDGFNVNESLDAGAADLRDSDGDAAGGVPLSEDVDFRDVATPPVLDLNSVASDDDTDRGFSSTFIAGNDAVAIVDSDADALNGDSVSDFTYLTITPTSVLPDGANEILTIAGIDIPLNADFTQSGVTIPGTTARVDIFYIDGVITIREASNGAILNADMDALIRSVTYRNEAANIDNSIARTFDFQVAQFQDADFVIDLEDFTAGTRAAAADIESDPYWGGDAVPDNSNGYILNRDNPVYTLADGRSFASSLAATAEGNFLFHSTSGSAPIGEQVVLGRSDIPVVQDANYTVSVDLGRENAAAAGPFEIVINGEVIGVATLNTAAGVWGTYTFNFNAESNSTVDFQIRNLSRSGGGNDFAIDNVSFQREPSILSNIATATVDLATDTDNDGVINADDVDDDNDGILDINEREAALPPGVDAYFYGGFTLSVDGTFDNSTTSDNSITIVRPEGATVAAVYAVSLDNPTANAAGPDTVIIDGTTVILGNQETSTNNVLNTNINYWDDVTAEVGDQINALAEGSNTITLGEEAPGAANGVALVVVWNDPNTSNRLVALQFGSVRTSTGTTVDLPVAALDTSTPGFELTVGLAIGHSTTNTTVNDITTVTVNGTVVTTTAGGSDDGGGSVGGLITVGGTEDTPAPNDRPNDREVYDISSAVSDGDTNITIETSSAHEHDFIGLVWFTGQGVDPFTVALDSDGDGINDQVDIDADNDGITDNIEAQTTAGYIAPSGIEDGITDINQDGLDDAYDQRTLANGGAGLAAGDAAAGTATGTGEGLRAVNTDGTDEADYLDTDSDNEGGNDTAEAGLTGTATGLSTDATDADGDGLFDVFETQGGTDADDGFNVNESLDAGALALPDIDADAAGGVPLTADVDFRDAEQIDTDNDGVIDFIDVDDDNDGILDVIEQTVDSQQIITSAVTNTNEVLGTLTSNGTVITTTTTATEGAVIGTHDGIVDDSFSFDETGFTGTVTTEFSSPVSDIVIDFASIRDTSVLGNFTVELANGVVLSNLDFTVDPTLPSSFGNTRSPLTASTNGDGINTVIDANGGGSSDQAGGTLRFAALDLDQVLAAGGIVSYAFDILEASGSTANALFNISASALADSDADGIADHLDLDSDNDGITDNIEAQSTADYIAPSGIEDGITDLNQDGLDDNFDSRTVVAGDSAATETEALIVPVDTDSDDTADVLDTDSDNEGGNDTVEAGLTGTATGLSTDATDADGDGLFDVFETQGGTDADDGFNVNESLDAGALSLPDIDADASGGVPLTQDVDFRDAEQIDTDNDGVIDFIDVDDDNDGILDITESNGLFELDITDDITPALLAQLNSGNAITIENVDGIPDLDLIITPSSVSGATFSVGENGLVFNHSNSERATLEFTFSSSNPALALGNVSFTHNNDPVSSTVDGSVDEEFVITSTTGTVLAPVRNYGVPGTAPAVFNITDGFYITNGASGENNSGQTDIAFEVEFNNVTTASFSVISVNSGSTETIQPIGNLAIVLSRDTDSDGIFDHLDIDSDNDGITDNIEAQTTLGYIAPSGVGGTPGFIDVNLDGLDDAFDNRNADNGNTLDANSSAATQIEALITPVNTDGTDNPDYLDTDSDNEGGNDTAEAGLTGTATGLSTDANDADGDGLFDVFDTQGGTDADDGFNVNESLAAGAFALPDADGDAADGVPLTADVDFRDAQEDRPDTDSDGILDVFDVDDDNDGILDVVEGFVSIESLGLSTTESTLSFISTNANIVDSRAEFNDVLRIADGNQSNASGLVFNGTLEPDADTVFTLGLNVVEGDVIETFELRASVRGLNDLDVRAFDLNVRDLSGALVFSTSVPDTGPTGTAPATVTGFSLTEGFYTVEFIPQTHGAGSATVSRSFFSGAEIAELGFVGVINTGMQIDISARDTDSDGIYDHLDIDSDNDGITDNIEAQSTAGYIAPSGIEGGITDLNQDGLDDNYDSRTVVAGDSAATDIEALITPVDTDSDDTADYLDTDSDNEGGNDTVEAGLTGTATGLSTDATDADGDGLFDVFETQGGTDADDGFNVNESLDAGALALPDIDADAAGGVPLTADVDFRDAQEDRPDTDSDGILDVFDVDDDNDGILDTVETPSSTLVSFLQTFNNVLTINNGDVIASGSTLMSGPNLTLTTFNGFYLFNGASTGDLTAAQAGGNYIEGAFTTANFTQDNISIVGLSHLPRGNVNFNFAISISSDGFVTETFLVRDQAHLTSAPVLENEFGLAPDTDYEIRIYAYDSVNNGFGHRFDDLRLFDNSLLDTDGDGIDNSLDIDSDNDGITDNIEAQSTAGYIAPSGVESGITDINQDGLDDNYDARSVSNGGAGLTASSSAATEIVGLGLDPVNTDAATPPAGQTTTADTTPDYLDTDSDGDGFNDTVEAGLGTAPATGLSIDATDADGDGLFDVFETQLTGDVDDGFVVNEDITPLDGTLPDAGGDASVGTATPLVNDLDFRDLNDAPVAQNDGFTTTENATATVNLFADNGNMVDSDPDGDTITVTRAASGNDVDALDALDNGDGITVPATPAMPVLVDGSNGGTFVVNANGGVTFDPGSDFEDLAVGETRTTQIVYQITDPSGEVDRAVVTFTVTGQNDLIVPVIPGVTGPPAVRTDFIPDQTGMDDAAVTSLDLSTFFTDPDGTDVVSFMLDTDELPEGLTFDGTTISGTPDNSASQGGPNSDGVYEIDVTVTDSNGDPFVTTVTYTITNPAPVAENDNYTTAEDTPLMVNVLTDNDTDPDGDELVVDMVALADGTLIPIGEATEIPEGTLTVDADGSVMFEPRLNFFGPVTFGYTISDGQGGTDVATVTIDVTPVNDAPIPVDPSQPPIDPTDPVTPTDPEDPREMPLDPENYIPVQEGEDGNPQTEINLTPFFGDPDPMEPLVISLDPADLPSGLTFDPETGIISGTPDSDASQGGDPTNPGTYVVAVTVTDPSGETFTTNLTYVITNPAPEAMDDGILDVVEDTPTILDLVGNDTDPDGDDLVIIEINGTAVTVGVPVELPSGAIVTLNPDGSVTYEPVDEFNGPDSFTYTISDGEGGTDTATAALDVTPANDPPSLIPSDPMNPVDPNNPDAVLPPRENVDGETIMPVDVSGPFEDIDGDPLTFTATGLPPGLTIDPVTGVITGTLPPGTSAEGPFTVTITATDPDGQSVSTEFVWGVENVAPEVVTPLPNVSFDDGSGVSLPTAATFTDPDGDVLTFTAVNLPEGLSIDPETGLISGTIDGSASQEGPYDITVTATDAQGASTSSSFTMTVENVAPIIDIGEGPNTGNLSIGEGGVPVVERVVGVGEPITFDFGSVTSDPDGDEGVTFSIDGDLPLGLTLDPVTGILSGSPIVPTAEPHEFTIIADDGEGGKSRVIFVLVVTEDGYVGPIEPAESQNDADPVDPYEFLDGQPIDLQRYFYDRALEARDDYGRMFGDKDFRGGMVAVQVPGLGNDTAMMFVEAIVDDHHVTVSLGSTVPMIDNINVRSWDVDMANGSSLPEWIDWSNGSDVMQLQRQAGTETVSLRVRALLDNGQTSTITVEIDLNTGAVVQQGEAYVQGQTLQQQMALEAQDVREQMAEADTSQEALLRALAG